MITIRQIERAWQARTYEKLFRELVANRPESTFRFEHEQGRAIPAAAMAIIRLEELSQAHVSVCAQLIRAVVAGRSRLSRERDRRGHGRRQRHGHEPSPRRPQPHRCPFVSGDRRARRRGAGR